MRTSESDASTSTLLQDRARSDGGWIERNVHSKGSRHTDQTRPRSTAVTIVPIMADPSPRLSRIVKGGGYHEDAAGAHVPPMSGIAPKNTVTREPGPRQLEEIVSTSGEIGACPVSGVVTWPFPEPGSRDRRIEPPSIIAWGQRNGHDP